MSGTARNTRDERFREVFDSEFAYVARGARRLGVAPGDVEDVAQEVFAAVLRHFDSYDTSRPLRPWVATFMIHAVSNYRRLARHRIAAVDSLDPWGHDDPGRGEPASAARALLLRALDALTPEQREVVVLHDLDGHRAEAVAEVLAVPIGTVRSRLRSARSALEVSVRRERARERSEEGVSP